MNVLVTGGAGYIGSHTSKALALAGHTPIVFDNLSKGHRWAAKWGPLIEGDIADTRLVAATIRERHIEAVMHFAGFIEVGESMRDPGKYFESIAGNSLSLLRAMAGTGVARIVFSSTAAVYGQPEHTPIEETHPCRPVNPYGEAKLFVERALEWYGACQQFSWAALRYFNAAGADPDGEPESHLIPRVLQAALGELPSVGLFGNDYPTPDGTAIRDYIHVTDLAQAHVKALEYLAGGGESAAINLGTGVGHSVREVIEAAERVAGRRIPVEQHPRRAGDAPILVAKTERAAAMLGWRPRYTGLEKIMETAWQWHHARVRS
jgi:UDP-arabinose 4-epimerase